MFYVRRVTSISRSIGLIKFDRSKNNGLGINPDLCFDFRDGQRQGGVGQGQLGGH